MTFKMATDSETRNLPVPDQLYAYADAYLASARSLCQQTMLLKLPNSWPNGAVILMTAAHSVELFLKAAIIARDPSSTVLKQHPGHDINALSIQYSRLFPEPENQWCVPFNIDDFDPADPSNPKIDPPSIVYRYPLQKTRDEWRGHHAFVVDTFDKTLAEMAEDYKRLRANFSLPQT